jgi:cytochrome c-type protein NapB
MSKILTIAVAVTLLVFAAVAAAEELKSLRGVAPIDEEVEAPDMKQVHRDQAPIPRNYVQQPPLIPHTIRNYDVDLRNNKCLNCHSWKNYRTYNATKISQTHFVDANGVDLADVSPRRYFCLQCHVVQTDAEPLIANDFKEVEALSH